MPDRLVIPAGHVAALRDHLLQDDGLERCAYVSMTRSGNRFLAADVMPVPDEAMRVQRRTACRPALSYEREQVETCMKNGYELLVVHSHAFSDAAWFSVQDEDAVDRYRDWIHGLYPGVAVAFAVLGRCELAAIVFDPDREQSQALPIDVVGNWLLDPSLPTDDVTADIDADLHDRSLRVLTEAGQQRIAATTVAIAGTGGLGFLLAKQLARLGVQKLVLIDPDRIEPSNLNRLTGTTRWDVERPKVSVLAQQLHETGLDVTVKTVMERVEDAEEALAGCDVIIGTVDQVSTRSFLNQYCVQHLRYYIDAGTVIRTDEDADAVTSIEGIVQLIAPGANACYACLDRADPERARREHLSDEEVEAEIEEGYIEDSELAPEPAVITLNGTIASQAASVFARLVAGYAAPPDMLRYEELDADLTALTTHRDPQCPTCGTDGMLAQGERDPAVDAERFDPANSDLDLSLPADAGGAPALAADGHAQDGVTKKVWNLIRRGLPGVGSGWPGIERWRRW